MIDVLVDSSFLYALYAHETKGHIDAVKALASQEYTVIVPEVTLSEVTFLFRRSGGMPAVATFLERFVTSGISLETLLLEDVRRATEIMKSYPEAALDFVDCCLMALSERLNVTKICTFDRRDFSIFRPTHCEYLELLP